MSSRKRRPRLPAVPFLLACVLFWLAGAGCSGPLPPPVPPAKEKAAAWNRRGLAAEARGDRDEALAAFGEALKLRRSVEDADGAAVALVNLARIHRLQGDLPLAKERIDAAGLLLPPDSSLFTETAFEKAKIGLASGDLPAAKEWAAKAVDSEKGDASGRMMNLLARVLLLEGKGDEALGRAETALAANRKAGARGEEANSLRLLGDIAAARRDGTKAGDLYAAALSIDKDLAESRKIAADLRALGAVAAAGGDTGGALAFYARAYDVSLNGDDPRGAAAALLVMARLYEKTGAADKAKAAMTEREKILTAIGEK
jgi:tetratricopeptide (TPR) repeat protein